MADADDRRAMSPWNPMTDPVDLKHLGKLMEELAELLAAAARCLIQGIDEREPVTGKLNRDWLEEEFADVSASMQLVAMRFELNYERMMFRTDRKMRQLETWHAMAGQGK